MVEKYDGKPQDNNILSDIIIQVSPLSDTTVSRESIIQFSVLMENSASDFYLRLAEKFPEQGECFSIIAKEESLHAALFERLLSGELPSDQSDQSRAKRNLRILDESGIVYRLGESSKLIEEVNTLLEALDIAVEHEKDTELYYYCSLGLYGMLEKDVVQKIIISEHGHHKKIMQLADNIRAEEASP